MGAWRTAFVTAALAGCAGPSTHAWMAEPERGATASAHQEGWSEGEFEGAIPYAMAPPPTVPLALPVKTATVETVPAPTAATPTRHKRGEAAEAPLALKLVGDNDERRPVAPAQDFGDELFRNTYYDFPHDVEGIKDAVLYTAECAPIAMVTTEFHDRVCVQGSGRLSSGATVSFVKRDCECAATCPRTGQKICYERLDAERFPFGRGSMGIPITPMRTIAVDPTVVPLGTVVYIPEFAGLPRRDGSPHDGCFIAEDRGIKVVGKHIDVFTGDPEATVRWNALYPSNRGVHVALNDSRCRPGG